MTMENNGLNCSQFTICICITLTHVDIHRFNMTFSILISYTNYIVYDDAFCFENSGKSDRSFTSKQGIMNKLNNGFVDNARRNSGCCNMKGW